MGSAASRIISLTSVYSIAYSDADQRKHQRSASLAFVRGSHRGPVNSPHKWPVTRKMVPFDDVIMLSGARFWIVICLQHLSVCLKIIENASVVKQTHYPDSKVHGANMGPIWGRQDPDGPHVGPMNFAISVRIELPDRIQVTRICLSKLHVGHPIGSDNSLTHLRHQAIIYTNAGLLWIGP